VLGLQHFVGTASGGVPLATTGCCGVIQVIYYLCDKWSFGTFSEPAQGIAV
jgi:hypothetical protein